MIQVVNYIADTSYFKTSALSIPFKLCLERKLRQLVYAICQCLKKSCYAVTERNKTMVGEVLMGEFYSANSSVSIQEEEPSRGKVSLGKQRFILCRELILWIFENVIYMRHRVLKCKMECFK